MVKAYYLQNEITKLDIFPHIDILRHLSPYGLWPLQHLNPYDLWPLRHRSPYGLRLIMADATPQCFFWYN